MFGTLSLKLGNVLGIPVRLHWTFLVLLYLLLLSWDGPRLELVFMLTALFGSVLLHELGHSLVARIFGIRVIDITFWPLGGMARMTEIPESSRVEGLVALAGPAVNFLLALIGLGAFTLFELAGSARGASATASFVGVNLTMGVFNLIPAFPMDGGRILRALFAIRNDWVRATERAVAVGRVIAGFLFFGSLALVFSHPQYVSVALIALFVWIAGGRELFAVRMRHGRWPFVPTQEATPWFRTETPRPAPVRAEPDPEGARRPAFWEFRSGAGFSENAVRDLERYRGRLRRPVDEDSA